MTDDGLLVRPRILSGFMELLPAEQILFNRMLDTIRRVYELYGYTPISTPTIELTDVLLAKGGGETERQVFMIGRNGLEEDEAQDKMLRFDLTVPFARYVAQYQNELTFPFRRSQLQQVWRAERPQAGRFREFWQCDVDVVSRTANLNDDAEIPSIIYAVFKALGLERITIRINNRKVLSGLAGALGLGESNTEILRIIDKVAKIGDDGVWKAFAELGVPAPAIEQVMSFIKITGSNSEKLAQLRELAIDSALYRTGVEELATVVELAGVLGVPESCLVVDTSLARGLDYYTSTVYETVLTDYPKVGSVCGGGRYDNLTSYYTKTELTGVGVSLGLTRLFYQLRKAGLLKVGAATTTKVLVATTAPELADQAFAVAAKARQSEIPAQVYGGATKIGKQLDYAAKLGIPWVIVIGDNEAGLGYVSLRDMRGGGRDVMYLDDAISRIWRVCQLESA